MHSLCAGCSFGVSFNFCFISNGMYVTNNSPCILFIQGNVVCYFPEVKSKAADELLFSASLLKKKKLSDLNPCRLQE